MRVKALCSLAVVFAAAAMGAAPDFTVTLLGTGTPVPRIDRFGPATLVEAGGEKLLIDCGRGVPIRLWQLQVPLSAVTAVFLTHLHSDHTSGIPDLWLTGWLPTPWGHRTSPFRIWGPAGTESMMANLQRAYAWDIRVRAPDENIPPEGVAVVAKDIAAGVVYEKNGVRVTAFEVDHGALLKPAFGYRIDYGGHSVVISGDTRPTENLVRFAKGTDLLIHEVAMASPELMKSSDSVRRIIGHHSIPQDVGKIFSRVKPKLAVYSHVVLFTKDGLPTLAQLVEVTRTTYDGPLQVGADLMRFDIGSTITVHDAGAAQGN